MYQREKVKDIIYTLILFSLIVHPAFTDNNRYPEFSESDGYFRLDDYGEFISRMTLRLY